MDISQEEFRVRVRINVAAESDCFLNLVGEGATGIPGPVGNVVRRGFFLNVAASGSSIRNFIFDGRGFSDANLNPLGLGIQTQFGTNNVTVDSNSFLGGLGAIEPFGSGWLVTHNVFDGFTILSNGAGGFGICPKISKPDHSPATPTCTM